MLSVAHAANQTAVKVGMKFGVWDLIWNSGLVVKFTLIILVAFSIVSWGIILTKHLQISRLISANGKFLDVFWHAKSLDGIFTEIDSYKSSPLSHVFKAGYMELQHIAESRLRAKKDGEGPLALSGLDNVSRALRKASDNEIARLEGRAGFLATVGSTSPFIGLFGTVWGIMTAFQNIGTAGTASLAVVAPGISEALIATAIGLGAAIPAVMAYNYFVGKFRKQDLEINNFSADFLNIVKRNFFKD